MLFFTSSSSLLHTSRDYNWDRDFGIGGAWLRELIGWYSFDEMHALFKAALSRDQLMSGMAGAILLLHWGDMAAAQADWRARSDNWQELARLVRQRNLALLPLPPTDRPTLLHAHDHQRHP